jgi:hypothetical protein
LAVGYLVRALNIESLGKCPIINKTLPFLVPYSNPFAIIVVHYPQDIPVYSKQVL